MTNLAWGTDPELPAQADGISDTQLSARQPQSRREMREMQQRAAARPPRSRRGAANQGKRPTVQRPTVQRRAARRSPANSVWPALGKSKKVSARALIAKLTSVGAMMGVGAMLVATSVPASAFYTEAVEVPQATASAEAEVQRVDVSGSEATTASASARDSYSVVSVGDEMRKRFGNQVFTFTNNPAGTIQWPFATGVPISSGFGPRAACSFCSSIHAGLDFAPGLGVPIQVVADGVVTEVHGTDGPYGVFVAVEHVINGQKVKTLYGHMLWGSPTVAVGQQVTVGQQVGAVGSTGNSTGPHLHFEVHLDGIPVDPYAWLKANAN